MDHSNLIWMADNNEISFSTTINSDEWYEYNNGFIVNYFEFVESKQSNIVVLYNSKMDLYYKLGPKSLTYSHSLNDNYALLYNGFWLSFNSSKLMNYLLIYYFFIYFINIYLTANFPNETTTTTTNSNNKATNNFKKAVNNLMATKKKTENLFNAILTSEVTTDSFEGPFGRKKS